MLKVKIVLILLFTFISVYFTTKYVKNNSGADLWCTTIGSRILVEKQQSPYFFKWNKSTDRHYIDPTDDNMHPVSRITFTPFLGVFFYVFAWMEMDILKWVYYCFTWAILFYILLDFKLVNKSNQLQPDGLLLFSIFMFNASGWWMHCSEGQKYSVYQ